MPRQTFNPLSGKFDLVASSVADISDIATTYLKLNQTTPQTTVGTFTFPTVKLGGTLATGLLKHTTSTGALSIAVAGDIPDLSGVYLPLAGGTLTGTLNSRSVIPTGAYDLGSTANYYSNLYSSTVYLNSTATLGGATAGRVLLTGNLKVSGGIGVRGTNPLATDGYKDSFSQAANTDYTAITLNFSGIATSQSIILGGISGYCTAYGRGWNSSVYISPLSYGGWGGYGVINFGNGTNANVCGLNVWGWGAYVWDSTQTLGNVYGGYISSFVDSFSGSTSGTFNITNATTLYLSQDDGGGTWNITTAKVLEIGAVYSATNRYQVVLNGNGAGSGIWLDGTSGERIYSDGTNFCSASPIKVVGGLLSSDGSTGATAGVAVAKVGGGTRTLNFKNGLYIDYTDS